MREIKFRAFDKLTKQIFKVRQIDFNAIERNIYGFITIKSILGGIDKSLVFRSFDDIELMQYTGLKDKNGLEIYEGDIIKCDEYFGGDDETDSTNLLEVEFSDHKFMVNLIGCVGGFDLAELYGDFEVIGNIYENEEILK